ncbi:hypothetical protein ACH5RR_038824 [Cinchona calisaya]|uniref:ATP-dependent Clp protease proteolytic subunit n=1 Tax=Cinchona calisaya TaxID=153742 RepID=A0ABD2XWE3_9GENT
MEVASMASHSFPLARMKQFQPCSSRASTSSSSLKPSLLSTPSIGGSVSADFAGLRIRPASLSPYSLSNSRSAKRGVVTIVIPFSRGSAWEQSPPDLAFLLYENEQKPIYLYINSTGTTKDGEKLGYETEAFAIYDVMGYVKPPIFTLCVGNAWAEGALLLAAGAKGNRSALPSSIIMIKQVLLALN